MLYFIDQESKTTYIIQSKFRTNENNFEGKPIDINELANMDIDRVLEGELCDDNDNSYNGKIKQLIREIGKVSDIGKYKEKVIILANSQNCNQRAFKKLCNGFSPIVYDFDKVYKRLVFPVINGTYYNSSELAISLNLMNKSSSGAKISYEVKTEFDSCNITVVFVPTIEIGIILSKYKNSILKFNPRCYLELNVNKVNAEILNTIKSKKTNEFALFNNGITMLSDSTSFNERIGQKDKAQICISNPQIINGGQTAHTLSKIYQEILDGNEDDNIFHEKEVLLKIITFNDEGNLSENKKLKLIEDISKATNQQSEVDEADRRSNDEIQLLLQKNIFDDYGLYYERKKGEFSDGLHSKYIARKQLIQRERLIRLAVALSQDPVNARRSGSKVLFAESSFKKYINSNTDHHALIYATKLHDHLETLEKKISKPDDKYNVVEFGQAFRYGKYSVVSVVCNNSMKTKNITECIKISNQMLIKQ
ncbi:AIPR family protein [Shewanella surugensis]|uniref:AIPR family protein n=1 Tax=Shewanella surugensis TaxID=212020 RepID=A0ABT0LJ93_9GAMM|nr:AIPR family protein [Shewanella surugensis]MCL1127530.1 AIPR family protein [Shewanella surugensis]